jgi:hypothetical protein
LAVAEAAVGNVSKSGFHNSITGKVMMQTHLISGVGLLLTASVVTAQQPAIRQLGPVVATASETFGGNVFVRHTRNGVLVNDVQSRRLLFFDSTLSKFSVVADTTPATASAYGGRTGGLIAYHGDSSLFVDAQSMSMLVIDPTGKVTRVISVPRSQDALVLGNPTLGSPSFDARGRLVYRGMPGNIGRMLGGPPAPGAAFTPPQPPDSVALIAVNLATRQVDTVTFTKVPKVKMDVQRDDNGRVTMSMVANPLPVVDDWAVLSDGSIAVVRGQDYHVDWIRPDGTRESSPKIPFDWKRLTDEDKVAFIDSVKAARERMMANAQSTAPGTPNTTTTTIVGGGEGATRARPGRDGGEMIVMGGPRGGPGGAGPMAAGGVSMVPPSELPDYQPVFFAGQVRADADGHLWVRTIPTKGIAGGPVYDVINSKGELIERVQVPKDRTIIGFGAGGVVYLLVREQGARSKLEKARFK